MTYRTNSDPDAHDDRRDAAEPLTVFQTEPGLMKAVNVLSAIAYGKFENARGHSQNYTREEMMALARSACVGLSVSFTHRMPKRLP